MLYAAGIDLGGTNIKYGIADAGGNILFEGLTETGGVDVLNKLRSVIRELAQEALSRNLRIEGIGIGVPAIMDGGIVTGCGENLPGIEGLALGELLEQSVGLPVVVENDASVMGFGELCFGAAKGLTDVVLLTVGTGIGGALVLNGALYGGYLNRGAELGHIRVASPGAPCSCGASGCLEAHASVKALIADYLGGEPKTREVIAPGEMIDGRAIFSRYRAGENVAVMVMNRHFDFLASGIASLINIFSPQKVIIGGGIADAGEAYIDPIRQRVFRLAMKETVANTLIEAARLGNKAGFLGAAARVLGEAL